MKASLFKLLYNVRIILRIRENVNVNLFIREVVFFLNIKIFDMIGRDEVMISLF